MDYISIKYNEPKLSQNWIDWTGKMVLPDNKSHEIYFHFTCPNPQDFRPSIRPFLLAYLVPAMRLGLPIKLLQPIDLVTYKNLIEWQEAFVSWRPNKLQKVAIHGEIINKPIRLSYPDRQAITAFSGGVDSCFTAVRHSCSDSEESQFRKSNLKAGLMIQGFDIPISQDETFELAWRRSCHILENLNLSAYRLKTNLRSLERLFGCNWEYETHSIWLAASLSCYESFFDLVLIPATYSYDILKFPWASNPITDPLFSSEMVNYWHEGAAYNKLTKVNKIAHNLSVQQNIRVCWQGSQLDRNCGKCFKCVATQICFWLSDVPNPPAFDNPCTYKNVALTYLKNRQNVHLFQLFAKEAENKNHFTLARSLNKALREQPIIKLRLFSKKVFSKMMGRIS